MHAATSTGAGDCMSAGGAKRASSRCAPRNLLWQRSVFQRAFKFFFGARIWCSFDADAKVAPALCYGMQERAHAVEWL
jgi:hypothetical protein